MREKFYFVKKIFFEHRFSCKNLFRKICFRKQFFFVKIFFVIFFFNILRNGDKKIVVEVERLLLLLTSDDLRFLIFHIFLICSDL